MRTLLRILGLCLALAATGALAQTTLQVSPTSASSGGSVTATWSGIASPTSTDWLGMHVPGAANNVYVAWRYTGGAASGSVPFNIPSGVASGTYHLRLFRNNGYTLLATSNTFLVNPAVISGVVSAGGSPLAGVSFSGATGGSCTVSNASGQYSCSVPSGWSGTLTPSLVGYGFTPASRSYSSATGSITGEHYAAAATALSSSPASVSPGGVVSAAWTENSVPSATDWMGLYATGSANEAHLAWQYTGGGSSGTLPFTVPAWAGAGSYELRLFSNDGYLRLATGNSFTVTAVAISGAVTLSGSALPGVGMSAGSGTSCSFTNAAGQYTCTVPSGWSGTVTPSLSGYNFTPASRSYSNVVSDQVGQDHVATAAGGSAQLYFVHTDHLNTPRLVADATGTTVWRWDQTEPFGNNPADADPDGNSIAFDLPLRLPGQRYDAETGLHYNYFRDYDPSIGRYGESDPVGLRAGLDTYAFVGANPLAGVDPFGLVESGKGFSTRYGNWCGKNYSGGVAGVIIPLNPAAPVDSLDECCMTHDYCTAKFECPRGCMTEKERGAGKEACDTVLADCLDKLRGPPRNWPKPPTVERMEDAHFYCNKARVLYRK